MTCPCNAALSQMKSNANSLIIISVILHNTMDHMQEHSFPDFVQFLSTFLITFKSLDLSTFSRPPEHYNGINMQNDLKSTTMYSSLTFSRIAKFPYHFSTAIYPCNATINSKYYEHGTGTSVPYSCRHAG